MSARALLINECSSPQNDGCSCPLKIMGARPHFSREHFMNLFFYESFLYSCVFIHLFPISVLRMMSARALLYSECSSPQKDGCSSPPKNNGRAPSFFQESISWTLFLSCALCPFICFLFGCSLNNECSCPLEIMGAWAPKKMGARAP